MKTVGIILAGGSGSRLYPVTEYISKHLLPIFDKPMIFYPLFVLKKIGIEKILLITNPEDQNNYRRVLRNGKELGVNITYALQKKPAGIAEAFIIGKKFIKKNRVALILGDNIFFGGDLYKNLKKAKNMSQSVVFLKKVSNPKRFGIAYLNKKKEISRIVEKPKNPKSNYAVTGIYFYSSDVVNYAEKLKPSKRGELEITDINNNYLKSNTLKNFILNKNSFWKDAGTFESLLEASNLIKKHKIKF
jgi:glucose-1-phosphate thymidylyltransferase